MAEEVPLAAAVTSGEVDMVIDGGWIVGDMLPLSGGGAVGGRTELLPIKALKNQPKFTLTTFVSQVLHRSGLKCTALKHGLSLSPCQVFQSYL